MALSTAPVQQDLRPEVLRALIYAREGVGKTTFVSGWFPKTNYILDLEGGTRYLGGQHFGESIETYSQFSQKVNELCNDKHPFTTVTIDTGSALVLMSDQESGARHGKIAAGSVEFGKGISDRDGVIYRDLTKLLNSNLGVLLVCHAMRLADEEAGTNTWVPALPTGSAGKPGVREFCVGRFDNVWYAQRNGPARTLSFQPSGKFDCKSRIPMPDSLPLDAGEVYKAVKSGCDSLTAAKA